MTSKAAVAEDRVSRQQSVHCACIEPYWHIEPKDEQGRDVPIHCCAQWAKLLGDDRKNRVWSCELCKTIWMVPRRYGGHANGQSESREEE